MSEQPSVKRNYTVNLIYQVFNVITPFITAPYLSRVLGPEGVGIQSYTGSIQYYFLLLAALGTLEYGSREISRNRDSRADYSRAFWEIESMTMITSAACLAAWLLFLMCNREYRLYYIVLIPNLLGTMFDIVWFYNGLEKIHIVSVRNMAFKALGIVLIFAFVRDQGDTALCVLINSCITCISALSLWLGLPGLVERPHIKLANCRKRFRETMIYFLPTIAFSVYSVLDKTMIGMITGSDAQNGYYEQATKIVNTVKTVAITALNGVLGVRSSYLFKQGKMEEVKRNNEISINYTLFFGVGIMFGLFAVAREFVPIFFGPGYEEVTVLLYLFGPIVALLGISNSLGTHYYTPGGRIKESTKFLFTGAGVNFTLNLFLIRMWKARGAAAASVIAEVVNTYLYVANCRGLFTFRDLLDALWKKLAAGLVMFAAIQLIPLTVFANAYLRVACEVLLGAAVYLAVLLFLKDGWTKSFVQAGMRKLQKHRG